MHRKLDAGILCNNDRNPRSYQQQRLAVVAGAHERHSFPLKSSHFAVRQDRLQSITDLNTGAMVINRVKNQYSTVGRLASYSPLMEQINRITFHVGAVERSDGHYRDLGMSLFVDLAADLVDLRDCVPVQNVGKVVDVIGGFEFGDRFGLRCAH